MPYSKLIGKCGYGLISKKHLKTKTMCAVAAEIKQKVDYCIGSFSGEEADKNYVRKKCTKKREFCCLTMQSYYKLVR